jgi:hypothetical protein
MLKMAQFTQNLIADFSYLDLILIRFDSIHRSHLSDHIFTDRYIHTYIHTYILLYSQAKLNHLINHGD